jgi:hypothetical protein
MGWLIPAFLPLSFALIPTASPSDPDDFSGWRNRAHAPAPLDQPFTSRSRLRPRLASPAGPMRACRGRLVLRLPPSLSGAPMQGHSSLAAARPEAVAGEPARHCDYTQYWWNHLQG